MYQTHADSFPRDLGRSVVRKGNANSMAATRPGLGFELQGRPHVSRLQKVHGQPLLCQWHGIPAAAKFTLLRSGGGSREAAAAATTTTPTWVADVANIAIVRGKDMGQPTVEQGQHLRVFRLVESRGQTEQDGEQDSCSTFAQTTVQEEHARLEDEGRQVEHLRIDRE